MDDIKYEIIKEIGVLSENAKGWNTGQVVHNMKELVPIAGLYV